MLLDFVDFANSADADGGFRVLNEHTNLPDGAHTRADARAYHFDLDRFRVASFGTTVEIRSQSACGAPPRSWTVRRQGRGCRRRLSNPNGDRRLSEIAR